MTTEERLHALNTDSYLDKDSVFKRMQDAIGIKLSDVNSPFKLINLYYKDSLYADVATFEKCTLLHVATLFNCHRLAGDLIEIGADVNSKGARGRTPLHYAAIQGHIEVAKVLINKGACIVSQDCSNRTPYYYALKYNHPEIASLIDDHIKSTKFLTDKGADRSCPPAYIIEQSKQEAKDAAFIAVMIVAGVTPIVLTKTTELPVTIIILATIASMLIIGGIAYKLEFMRAKHELSSKLGEVKLNDAPSCSQQPT